MIPKFLTLAVCTLFAVSCANQQTPKTESIRKVRYEVVATVQSTPLSTLPAKLVAAAETNCSFRVAGVLESIDCREGDFVKKGDVVAQLDSRDYEIQLAATVAEHDAIKGEVERIIALYEKQSVPKNDYEKAVSALKQISSKLSAHQNALDDTKLRAPFSGYIQHRNFDRGAALSAGMPVVSMISSSLPEVVLNIPAAEYIRRDELTSATASIEIFKGVVFPLKPLGVSHKANLNGLYEARFQLTKHEGVTPTAGMVAMVQLNYPTQATSQIEIPLAAIIERGGKSYVWIINDLKVSLREVSVSEIKRNGIAALSSGLSAGDKIVTAGVGSLKEGDDVRLLEQPSASNIGNLL